MNLPPTNIDPSDLWTQITQLPRPHRLVDFPQKVNDQPVGQVAVVVLTQAEVQEATLATEAWVRGEMARQGGIPSQGQPKNGYEILFENRSSVEQLQRCVYKADLTARFFPSPSAISLRLTVDQIAALLLKYHQVRAELGPIVSELSQKEMDAWIDVLAKGAATSSSLGFIAPAVLNQLLIYSASQCYALRTANSSHGTPSDDAG